MNIEQLCEEAKKRVHQHINRCVGQHKRAMRKQYPQPVQPDMKVWFVGPEPEEIKEAS